MTQSSSKQNGRSALNFREVCEVSAEIVAQIGARVEVQFPIQIPWLVDEAERKYAAGPSQRFKVNLHARAWGSKHIAGLILRYSDHANILYSNSYNTCWRRFIIAKELAHLFLDSSEAFTEDPEGLVQGLINAVPNIDARADLQAEHICPLAAVELLLPRDHRPQLYAMNDSGVSVVQIAQHCRVPQKIVSLVLSPGYRTKYP